MTLSSVSNHMASYLDKNMASDIDNSEIYAYGLEILLGATIKLLVIIVSAWLLNSLPTTLVVLVTYAALRCFGGGAHMSTYIKCLLVGSTIIVSLGRLSHITLATNSLRYLAFIVAISALIICLKWAPGDTANKPIRERSIWLRQKKKMSITILFWISVVFYLIQQNLNAFALAMILGCVFAVFLITPWGYRLFELIDRFDMRGGDNDEIKEVGHEYSCGRPYIYCRNRN